ncbi:hypothetical protein B7P43_G05963 [Cryptotermes secundus]|uniref:Uncharacterized protein n=1 Tax=Cryptotermes secundus TaxID=105785 RepID=A0A2J7PZT1_9NEOP|nr:uncharacterized protein LOC111870769 [Cryptotermes secundus]PNF21836.1 hypothetical protein B7P43_G05963 [Cryptotermes secundus]
MELKVVLLLITALYCHTDAAPTYEDMTKDAVSSCQKSSGISDAEAQELEKTKIVMDESKDSQKCFVACLISKQNIMTGGKLNVDFLVMVMKISRPENGKKFDEQEEVKYRKEVGDCNERSGGSKCAAPYNKWKCFVQVSLLMMLANDAKEN